MRAKLLYLASTLVSAVAAAPLGCGSLDGHTGTHGTLATTRGSAWPCLHALTETVGSASRTRRRA